MLNVLKLNEAIPEVIEVDQYIPLKIRWGSGHTFDEETIYWRTGDLRKSMLEIGVGSESGLIRSLTIVHTDKIVFNAEKILGANVSYEGTPVFDVQNWPRSSKIDDVGLFEIQYCTDEINLIISRNNVMKIIVSGRVCFGLDDNSDVCIISVSGLSDEEKNQIRDTLEFMKKSV